mmetsp:Transcript_45829/g.115415  ORF Transcript_45829/g.115415 Transcript_45829/m.115415 type:complete len:231 (+) Transcript_45829:17-709(+)
MVSYFPCIFTEHVPSHPDLLGAICTSRAKLSETRRDVEDIGESAILEDTAHAGKIVGHTDDVAVSLTARKHIVDVGIIGRGRTQWCGADAPVTEIHSTLSDRYHHVVFQRLGALICMIVVFECDLQCVLIKDGLPVFDEVSDHTTNFAGRSVHRHVILGKGELGRCIVLCEEVVNEIDLVVRIGKVITVQREPEYLTATEQMVAVGKALVDRDRGEAGLLWEIRLVEDAL